MRITIEEVKVTEKKGVSRKTQEPYTITEQAAYAHIPERDGTPKKYPTPITVPLEQGAKPYPVGEYDIAPASFMAGEFGQLKLGRIVLSPAASVARKAA